MAVVHQQKQLALAHHRVGEVQAGKLDLPRVAGDIQLVEDPVVERPVVLELKGADGMGDPLEGVGQAMGEIVHRVDAPVIPGPVMVCPHDPVDHRVAHIEVARCHVDPGPQHMGAVFELTGPHPGKKVEILCHAPVPIGTLPARLF